jgi:hypothetical protein
MPDSALILLSDASAGWGTISYNGHTFSGLRGSKLKTDPQWDDYRRYIKATLFTLEVAAYQNYTDVAAANAGVLALRRKLARSAGSLTITGLGLGDITVNPGSRDVEWGPRCGAVAFEPVGATVHVTFTLTWMVADAAVLLEGGIVQFGHEVEWSFDESDIQTRTVMGFLEVSANRNGSTGDATFTPADALRNQILCEVPVGFKRTSRRFKQSGDMRRLDFTFVDTQLEAEPPPENCVKADIDFEYENVPPGFAQWKATLSGSIELPARVAPIKAAEAFMRIYLDKQRKMRAAVAGKGFVLPTRIRFGRTLGSRVSSFAAAWTVTGCLDDLLAKGGIWEPLDGLTWTKWAASMVGKTWANRGSGGLFFNRTDGAIVSLVDNQSLPKMGTGAGVNTGFVRNTGTGLFSTADVPADLSWIWFENTLEAQRSHNAVTHVPSVPYVPAVVESGGLQGKVGVKMAQPVYSPKTEITQYMAPPTDLVLMTGKALRVDHLPAIPRLASMGGKPVQEMKVRIDGPKPVACFFGKTVFSARWAILYRVVGGYNTENEAQENPALCCPTSKKTDPKKKA